MKKHNIDIYSTWKSEIGGLIAKKAISFRRPLSKGENKDNGET